jgi:AraC family transcriptional regulator
MSIQIQIPGVLPEPPVALDLPSMQTPAPTNRNEVLARLLATATTVLDADRLAAKTCIQRAATLLGIDLRDADSAFPRSSRTKGGLAAWQARRVRCYIEENLSANIRIPALAAMLHISTSHFFRSFRHSFGETPQSYIMKRRMLRGQELMLNSQHSLSQIALEVGMCDQAHFSRTFRRMVGSNPNSWRRRFVLNPPPH